MTGLGGKAMSRSMTTTNWQWAPSLSSEEEFQSRIGAISRVLISVLMAPTPSSRDDADGSQFRFGLINYGSQTTSVWPIYGAAVV
jgi:hypothetical protein